MYTKDGVREDGVVPSDAAAALNSSTDMEECLLSKECLLSTQCSWEAEEELVMEVELLEEMQVFVTVGNCRTITLNVSMLDTIFQVRQALQCREHCSIEHTRLSFCGKPLKDAFTVMDYNIQKHSTLTLSCYPV